MIGATRILDDMGTWRARLNGDPTAWLLDDAEPAVRHWALRELLDRHDHRDPIAHPDQRAADAAQLRDVQQ